MQFLKQSTAATTVVGPILDSTGAEYTGAVIGDMTITKNGTSAAMASAATLTHIANGHYTLAFTTGNTDTLGRLDIHCNKSTYQMPPKSFQVCQATVFDALVTNAAGGANGLLLSLASNQVDVGKIIGTALTETSAGYLAAAFKKFFDIAAPVFTMASVNQTGDSYTRIGANGAGLTDLGTAITAVYNIVNSGTYGLSALKTLIDTLATYVDTEVAAIKAKTDNLPPDPADASDIAASFSSIASTLSTIAAYIDTEVAAIKAKTDNLPSDPADASDIAASFTSAASALAAVSTLVSAIKAITDNHPANLKNWLGALAGKTADSGTLAEINETTAGAGYDNTTDSLQAVRDNLPTGSGSGANTVTITVQTTGSVAIEGASVSAWNSSTLIATGTTNASGVVVLSLDSATYTVNVSKAGYNGTSASLAVSGATSSTRQLSAITITPSDPPTVTGYAYTYESNGTTIRTGVDIEYFMVRTDVGGTGSIVDPDTETLTSNGSGLVEFTGLLAGATYKAREVGRDKWHSFIADDETFQIKSFVG